MMIVCLSEGFAAAAGPFFEHQSEHILLRGRLGVLFFVSSVAWWLDRSGWVAGRLAGWLVGWSVDRLAGWLAGRLAERLAG